MLTTNFKDDGYVVVRDVVPGTKLEQIRDLTDRIIRSAESGYEDPFSRYFLPHRTDQGVLYDLVQRHPEFQELAKIDAVLDILDDVLGDDIFLYVNSLIYKPKGKANAVPWHQDFLSRPNEPRKVIVWIAIDNATKANGCLHVIPRSHKKGILPWYRVKGETHHDRVYEEHIDKDSSIAVELNAGDALLFDAMLLHSSDEVHSDQPRRAFRLAYQGFDAILVPRGVPIVVRGGAPESVANKFARRQIPKKGVLRRIINRIGRVLAKA